MPYSQKRICKECGKEFIAKSPRQFYCKDDHYRLCPICGEPVLVKPNTWNDPPRCCSKECTVKLKEQTCLEKYGTADPGNSKESIEKRKQTNLKKYGNTNAGNTIEAREKSRKTCLERYGTTNPGAGKVAKEKRRKTNLERYGVENAMSNPDVYQKSREGLLKKYGVDNARKIPGIDLKIQDTDMKKYSYPWHIAAPEIRAKSLKTNIERYGIEDPRKHPEVQLKIKNTCLERYGVSCPCNLEIAKENARKTMLEKYGVEFPSQSEVLRARSREACMEKFGSPYPITRWHISKTNRTAQHRLQMLGFETKLEFPIEKYMYDIHIKNTNILIEIDPTYTHNTVGNHWNATIDEYYHYNKSATALKNGYRCIHIFDWDDEDKIFNSLVQIDIQDKCYYITKEVDNDEAKLFLSQNKICNSYVNESVFDTYYGMYLNNELVMLLSIHRIESNRFDISFCNKLKYFNIMQCRNNFLFNKFIEDFHPEEINLYRDMSKDFYDYRSKLILSNGAVISEYVDPMKIWSKGKDKIIAATDDEELKLLDNGYLSVYDCGYEKYTWKLV